MNARTKRALMGAAAIAVAVVLLIVLSNRSS